MTTGTKIIQKSLSYIGAHSVVNPANPESILTGMDTLNGMIAEWQDENIEMGAVPLNAPGDELSEPLGTRNNIEFNLAVLLQPLFPGTVVSVELRANALKGFNSIKRKWQTIVIPKKQARGTLPLGQGNRERNGRWLDPFFNEGQEIG